MEVVIGSDPACSELTPDELAQLNPTANTIAAEFDQLPPNYQANVIALILSAVRRHHCLDDSLDLVQFILGQGVEQEYQVAA